MGRSKKHHYIPQCLQRWFTTELGGKNLWYAKKDNSGSYSEPELRNISSAFKKRNFYTITHNGKETDLIERLVYGNLDDALSRFLQAVHEGFNRGVTPILTGEALFGARQMMVMMMMRTPYFIRDYDDEKIGREVISEILRDEIYRLSNEEITILEEELNNPSYLAKLGREARVRSSAQPTDNINNTLNKYVIRWAKAQGKSSFILSSLGVCRIGNGGSNGLASPTAEAWMPISPKICAVMVQDPNKQIPPISEFDSLAVRTVNAHLANEADEIASHSQRLLKTLIARETS